MSRHTKIVATLGPASSTPEILERMVQAGIDVVRMNFSHGTAEDHRARATAIRAAAAKYGRTVGILGDLQGPKIRVGKFEDGKIDLVVGASLILDAQCTLGNTGAGRARLQGTAERRQVRRHPAPRRRPARS